MTPDAVIRPVLFVLALSLAGCGAVEHDPHRFQAMGDRIADIDVPLTASAAGHAATPRRSGPKLFSPVHVAVMSPHEMWDARDALALGRKPVLIEAAAFKDDEAPSPVAPAQPAPKVIRVAAPAPGRTIQLGAYSSEAGAKAAWGRMQASGALNGLSPVFEPVEVGGRSLTRLKVGPVPVETAANLCRAAQIADPWCRHAG